MQFSASSRSEDQLEFACSQNWALRAAAALFRARARALRSRAPRLTRVSALSLPVARCPSRARAPGCCLTADGWLAGWRLRLGLPRRDGRPRKASAPQQQLAADPALAS
eukprot:COSAG06_NODE_5619_length_3356_cov_3.849555_6_plen_108_part_01